MRPSESIACACPGDPESPDAISKWAIARAKELGFAAACICEARPSARGGELKKWIEDGMHGPMAWMTTNVDTRLDVSLLFPSARSILVVADRYHDGTPDTRRGDGSGRVARYARGRDYHRRMKRRLRTLQREMEAALPGVRGKVCCDIEPFMEREHGERAGLGRCGKHTLLIVPGLGSWVLLAAYVTSARMASTGASPATADPCGSCTRCIDACPTGAITPWMVDSRKCLSAVTLEERGSPDPEIAAQAGDWLLGCDICQEVCPHNQPTRKSKRAGTGDTYDGRNASFSLLSVLGWDDAARRTAFGPSALNRVRADQVRRNALWCSLSELRQRPGGALEQAVRAISVDPGSTTIVREAAIEVLNRLSR